MAKYIALLRYMVIRSLQFRSELVIWTILDAIPFLVLFLIWIGMYQDQDTIRGYTLHQTINYYLLVILIGAISDIHFEEWRSDEIRNGKIDFFLIRPLSYIHEILWKDIGGKVTYIAMFLPIFLLFLGITASLNLGTFAFPLSRLVLFLPLLILAYLINFMIGLWIVLGTFWLEGSHGLQHFKWVTITLLSGSMLPLAFMPSWMSQIVHSLPLKYLYAVPIGVVQGTYQFGAVDAVYLSATVIGMFLFSRWLWSKAVYQYASVGG
ncbi:MAG TPA: ABC-2 family transporter protein [Patescibacteria group bacterium]